MTMTPVRKTQLLIWLVVLLLVMNAVTIGTILYHNYQERQAASASLILPGGGGSGPNPLNGRFLRKELGFDWSQMDSFRKLNQNFRPKAMDISFQIDSLKELMFEKMQEPQPDSLGIETLADQVGALHKELKSETFRFYEQLRRICRDDQKARLKDIFRPLFVSETMGPSYGPRNGRGPGWRNPIIN